MKKFYITTPIYYVNDTPHIGHAYTTILADVLKRYNQILGKETFFLTGTDEHGQKVQEAAQKRHLKPQTHVDEYVIRFQDLWTKLNIQYSDFIRTTEPRHTKRVKNALQNIWDRGEIYEDEYEGLYSVSEERFITEKEYEDGSFKGIKKLKEKNYFFKMSLYQEKLIKYIKDHPNFIQPESRKNEILGFLQKPLNDLCISRPKSRLNWGIELPFDKDFVTYVWFDALLNYITAIGWNNDKERFEKWWPANYHLIGKDILTTHAVYWPIMLMAMKLPLPECIFAHGWWLSDEEKMSKSVGNVVDPLSLIDEYGTDSVRYFLMRDMVLGNDATFSMDNFIKRYNADLANDYGNLVNRVMILINKNFNNKIPEPGDYNNIDLELIAMVKSTTQIIQQNVEQFRIHEALERCISIIREVNKFLEQKEPWKTIKINSGPKSSAATTLYLSAETVRICSQLLHPVMPSKTLKILNIICSKNIKLNNLAFGLLESGKELNEIFTAFPRIET